MLLRMNPRNKIACTNIVFKKKKEMMTLHNIQEATTMEEMGINIPMIYASLEDQQAKH
jgi:hypothetical protein